MSAINLLKNAAGLLAIEPYTASNAQALNDVRQALAIISVKPGPIGSTVIVKIDDISVKKPAKKGSKTAGKAAKRGRKPADEAVSLPVAADAGGAATADVVVAKKRGRPAKNKAE